MSPNTFLHRYWLVFDTRDALLHLGCGVTAFTLDDALRLLRERLRVDALPPLAKATEDLDLRTLDPNHVRPNAGDPSVRGVWFPNLG